MKTIYLTDRLTGEIFPIRPSDLVLRAHHEDPHFLVYPSFNDINFVAEWAGELKVGEDVYYCQEVDLSKEWWLCKVVTVEG